jgi:site-specific DNA-methyltransferase (adenine-specific)
MYLCGNSASLRRREQTPAQRPHNLTVITRRSAMNLFGHHSTVTPSFALPRLAPAPAARHAVAIPAPRMPAATPAPAAPAAPPASNDPGPRSADFEIIHGDCTRILDRYANGSFDLVVTDPPYIVGYRDRSGRSVANDDNDKWLEPAFREIFRVLAENAFCVSFYGWNQTDRFFAAWKAAGFRIAGHITFPKRYYSSVRLLRYQHESAYLLVKGQPEPANVIGDVIDWGVCTGNKLHPTQKPLSILVPLIQAFSKPGARVLDPFCGSASTLAAAVMCGRSGTGIELDGKIANVAHHRMMRVTQSGSRTWAED